jgi:hypothetical protein
LHLFYIGGFVYWCDSSLEVCIIVPKDPKSMEWFIEGQAFSQSYDLAPSPPPAFPLSPSVISTGDTQEDWERETTCWRERGRRGWARSRIIRSRGNLVYSVVISESYQNCQKWGGGGVRRGQWICGCVTQGEVKIRRITLFFLSANTNICMDYVYKSNV